MMSKTAKAIYLESFVDRAIKGRPAVRRGDSGAGFIYPFYSRSMFGAGDGEFVFMALGQPDVLPMQLPRERDYQNAYIVTLAIPMGVAEAHARFPSLPAIHQAVREEEVWPHQGRRGQSQLRPEPLADAQLEGQLEQYMRRLLHATSSTCESTSARSTSRASRSSDEDGNPTAKSWRWAKWTPVGTTRSPMSARRLPASRAASG